MESTRKIGPGRVLFEAMMEGSRWYGNWSIQNSNFILEKRRKLLFICLVPILIFAGLEIAGAAEMPSIIGGKTAYAPSFATVAMFVVSLLIGMIAGLITGCIGAGGGFILTPALMSVGVKGIMSVGTDMFHIFAKAIMGATIHRKMGNVSVALAGVFVIGSLSGATAGGLVQRSIYEANPALSDAFISVVYVFILGFIGFFTLFDFLRSRKPASPSAEAEESEAAKAELTKIALKIQAIKAPPYVTFDQNLIPGGRRLSIWPIIGVGLVVGFIAAIMGIGGGFVFFPTFVYLLGVSTFTTVGTDIFQIIFTAGYTSITQYAVYGFVFYTLAMGLLLGSLLGIQIGAITTKVVPGIMIKGFFATTVLGGFVNRIFALPGTLDKAGYVQLADGTKKLCDALSFYIFFAIVGVFAVWVIYSFLKGVPRVRAGDFDASAGGGH
ncbi:MAG: sulfite exporter TauE/SafE family protein [Clostridia bacterium]|nr:sulfite exporter TauE/SafE family protein [Clostridia bacterium]